MKITKIQDGVVPLRSNISNAYISFAEMTASAVAIHTDVMSEGRPVVGYGFNSNGRYAQSGILRERFIPRLMRAEPQALLDETGSNFSPEGAWQVMMRNEKPGGHGERSVAVGTIDMALWDIVAKIEKQPLHRVLASRYGNGSSADAVFVYAAGGYYYPGKDVSALQEEMQRYLDLGYTTVKIKIGGAPLPEDLKRIEAVLKILPSGGKLAVDANGRFNREVALAYAEALNQYALKWYEEPGDPLDFEIMKDVASASKNPVATGENLFSMQDSRNLLRYGGMKPDRDYLQMDPVLSYGLVEYFRILNVMKDSGWKASRGIPHGGHQFALNIAAGIGLHGNESYPGVFEPFGGFADGIPIENGTVRLPNVPGIGIESKSELHEVFRKL